MNKDYTVVAFETKTGIDIRISDNDYYNKSNVRHMSQPIAKLSVISGCNTRQDVIDSLKNELKTRCKEWAHNISIGHRSL